MYIRRNLLTYMLNFLSSYMHLLLSIVRIYLSSIYLSAPPPRCVLFRKKVQGEGRRRGKEGRRGGGEKGRRGEREEERKRGGEEEYKVGWWWWRTWRSGATVASSGIRRLPGTLRRHFREILRIPPSSIFFLGTLDFGENPGLPP